MKYVTAIIIAFMVCLTALIFGGYWELIKDWVVAIILLGISFFCLFGYGLSKT